MITKSAKDYPAKIERLKDELKSTDVIVVGAGAGLSTSAGFVYAGERFRKYFSDFEEKYGFHDMYSGAFCRYDTPEEHWAYCGKPVTMNLRSDNRFVQDEGWYKAAERYKNFFRTRGGDHNILFGSRQQ